MKMIKGLLARTLMLAAIAAFAHTTVYGSDFDKVVKNIETHYHAKRKKIRFLGVASFLVRIIKPAGVKSFKFAMFENQDFPLSQKDFEFVSSVEKSINCEWLSMVKSRSRTGGMRTYLYGRDLKKDPEILSVTIEQRQAIVVQVKVDPETLSKWLERPEFMGQSIAGVFKSNSIFGGSGGGGGGGGPDYSTDTNGIQQFPLSQGDDKLFNSKAAPTLGANSSGPDPAAVAKGEVTAAPTYERDPDAIRLEARLVNLNVRATDASGKIIPDLRKEDFIVLEDNVPQEVEYFSPVSAPINLVLLLDLSGSTKDKRKVMMKAARDFIDSLAAEDRIAVAAFTRKYYLISGFTTDRKLLKDRLEQIKDIQGGTSYYDAMWATLDLLDQDKQARRAIVVLTDGVDNSLNPGDRWHTDHTFDDLIARVAEEDATIYPIYLNTENPWPADKRARFQARGLNSIIEERERPYEMARQQLQEIADQTAGMVFKADTVEDLEGVYQRVASELRMLYSIAYAPKNTKNNGEWRRIGVKVSRAGAAARTRRGYYAK